MNYSEEQLLEAKKLSFEEGLKHSKSSPETRELLHKQMDEFRSILGAHEGIEQKNNEELSKKLVEVTELIKKHIEETYTTDKTIRELITGSKVAKGWFFTLVSIVAGIGVLATSAIAIKEWIKR